MVTSPLRSVIDYEANGGSNPLASMGVLMTPSLKTRYPPGPSFLFLKKVDKN